MKHSRMRYTNVETAVLQKKAALSLHTFINSVHLPTFREVAAFEDFQNRTMEMGIFHYVKLRPNICKPERKTFLMFLLHKNTSETNIWLITPTHANFLKIPFCESALNQ